MLIWREPESETLMTNTQRAYSTISYADSYFWKMHPDLAESIAKKIGDEYVKEETQIANIMSQLRNLGYPKTAKRLYEYTEEGERSLYE